MHASQPSGVSCAEKLMAAVWVVTPSRAPRVAIKRSCKSFYEAVDDDDIEDCQLLLQPPWPKMPAWFTERMEALRLEPLWADLHKGKVEYNIIGLMRLTHRGAVWHDGPMTTWTNEAQVLLRTYGDPLDAGIIKIVDAVELSEPFRLEGWSFAKMTSAERLFVVYVSVGVR